MSIPTLQTPRLTLRPMRGEDWPAYREMMATDRARFLDGPYQDIDAWGLFCADHAGWDLRGSGALMIDIRETRECAGQVCLNASPFFPEPELGWFLYEAFEGKGYASEAAAALKNWAFDKGGFERLVSFIAPDNAPSVAIVSRLGAVQDPTAKPRMPHELVFVHQPPPCLSSQSAGEGG